MVVFCAAGVAGPGKMILAVGRENFRKACEFSQPLQNFTGLRKFVALAKFHRAAKFRRLRKFAAPLIPVCSSSHDSSIPATPIYSSPIH